MGRELRTELEGLGGGEGSWGMRVVEGVWGSAGSRCPQAARSREEMQVDRQADRQTGPHLSTTKVEALWLTEAECSAHRPPGSSRVWMV